MKLWLIVLVVAALAGGGWWYWKGRGPEEVAYETVAVTRGDITQIVTATGTINPVINVQVGSQISGNILKLYADFNSPVKAGQVVAQLDPSIYQAIVHQMQADLASGKAALELAQATGKRKADLVLQHAAAQADLDTANAGLHQAEAQVQMKEANLEKAKADLDHCTIYSPIDGTVISRAVDVGQTVAAAMNAPVLFTVANDLSKMQIDSNVAEADVGNVELNQEVNFTVDAYPNRTFHGSVAQVRNAATTVQNVVTYDVVVSVANDDLKLKPGMTANLAVVVAKREAVLRFPNSALRFRPQETAAAAAVTATNPPTPPGAPGAPGGHGHKPGGASRTERTLYILPPGDKKPAPVTVKLGITDSINTEILTGLSEGQLVITGSNAADTAAGPSRPNNPLGGGARMR